jgi:hypothetical protein
VHSLCLPPAAVGNVRFSFEDVTVTCPPPEAVLPGMPRLPTPLASGEGVGIAESAAELVHYLGIYGIREILLAGGCSQCVAYEQALPCRQACFAMEALHSAAC